MVKLESFAKRIVADAVKKNQVPFVVPFTVKCYCKNPICPASRRTLLYLQVRKVTFEMVREEEEQRWAALWSLLGHLPEHWLAVGNPAPTWRGDQSGYDSAA